MLSLDDLKDYFQSLPLDLTILINNVSYKCNKEVVSHFSKTINFLINENTSTFSYNIPVSEESIHLVFDFLHGKCSDFSTNCFQCLCIAAFFDIPVVGKRCFEFVKNTTNQDNFEERYNFLKDYPEYCEPLNFFLINHKDFFNDFSSKHQLPSQFVKSLLSNCQSNELFENESTKLAFLMPILRSSNDMSLISLINLQNLDDDEVFDLIMDDLSPRFSSFLHVGKFYKKQIQKCESNLINIEKLKLDFKELQSKYEEKKALNILRSKEFQNLIIDNNINDQNFSTLHEDIKYINLEMNEIINLFNGFKEDNEKTIKLNSITADLTHLIQNLCKALNAFRRGICNKLHPNALPRAIQISNELKSFIEGMHEQIKGITVEPEMLEQLKTLIDELQNTYNTIFSPCKT